MPCHRSPWGLACAFVTQAALPAQVPAHATLLNPTTLQSRPTFVQQGDVVHAFAIGAATVFHARSLDGGRTWPLLEQPLGAVHTGAGAYDSQAVEVVARPGELLVLGDNGNLGPNFVRSLDGGTTWSQPTAIAATHVVQPGRMYPTMYANGATLLVAWANDRPNGRFFCNRSVDNGLTWQPSDTRLDLGVPANGVAVHTPRVIGTGPIVNVFWSQGSTYHQRSLDGGVTWLPAAVVMGVLFCTAVGDGSVLLVADRTGVLLRSYDAGASWLPVTSTGIPQFYDAAIAGQLVVAVGLNFAVPPTYLVNVSSNGGASWLWSPLALPSPSFGVDARAFARAGEVFVHWRIPGFPGGAIRSLDAGATWQVIQGPMQGGFDPGDQRTLHAESTDLTTPFPHHHAYVGVGSSRLGASTAGTGGIAPRLSTMGLPVRGGATTLRGEGAVGGSLAALGLSLQAPAAFPFGSATVHLASLDVLFGLPTSGASGQAGAGAFALPVAIPNSPSLVGVRLVAQALVVDGGALDGFTVTNALEIWLR